MPSTIERRRRRPIGVSSNSTGAVTLRVMMVMVEASMAPMAMPVRDSTPAAALPVPVRLGQSGAGRACSTHCTISRHSASGVPSSSTSVGTRVALLAARSRASSAQGSTSVGSRSMPFSISAVRAMRTKGEVVLASSCMRGSFSWRSHRVA